MVPSIFMQATEAWFLIAVALAGILAMAAVVASFRMRPARPSRIAVAFAALPATLMLILFYSLAIHMRQSLGAWPTSIGERGFAGPLIAHCSIATNYFSVFLLVSILAWPITFLLCSLIGRWRVCVYYLGVYGFACLACIGSMLLAPAPFLRWWWD